MVGFNRWLSACSNRSDRGVAEWLDRWTADSGACGLGVVGRLTL